MTGGSRQGDAGEGQYCSYPVDAGEGGAAGDDGESGEGESGDQ